MQAFGSPRLLRYTRAVRLELSEALLEELSERAKHLGIAPEELARAAVADLVARPSQDFDAAAAAVLRKNAELYRRLA